MMAGKEISRTSLENKDGAPLNFYTEISLVRIFQGFDLFQWGNCIRSYRAKKPSFSSGKGQAFPTPKTENFYIIYSKGPRVRILGKSHTQKDGACSRKF